MRLIVALLIAFFASAEASAEEYILAVRPGGPYTATPGGELARIQKQRPLPNAFGFGDIFGRKVENGRAWGTYSGGSGQFSGLSSGGAQVFGMPPVGETNTVLPPRAVDFLADPSQPIPFPTGHILAIHKIERQSIVFSITTAGGSKQSAPAKKGASDRQPDWKPW
jgi:hypothetical protein